MSLDMITSITIAIISASPAVIVAIIQLFTNYNNKKYRLKKEQAEREIAENSKKNDKLQLAMARLMLLEEYKKCIKQGYYDLDDRAVYHEMFEAYKNKGGNGIIDNIKEKILALPTEPPSTLLE